MRDYHINVSTKKTFRRFKKIAEDLFYLQQNSAKNNFRDKGLSYTSQDRLNNYILVNNFV